MTKLAFGSNSCQRLIFRFAKIYRTKRSQWPLKEIFGQQDRFRPDLLSGGAGAKRFLENYVNGRMRFEFLIQIEPVGFALHRQFNMETNIFGCCTLTRQGDPAGTIADNFMNRALHIIRIPADDFIGP